MDELQNIQNLIYVYMFEVQILHHKVVFITKFLFYPTFFARTKILGTFLVLHNLKFNRSTIMMLQR